MSYFFVRDSLTDVRDSRMEALSAACYTESLRSSFVPDLQVPVHESWLQPWQMMLVSEVRYSCRLAVEGCFFEAAADAPLLRRDFGMALREPLLELEQDDVSMSVLSRGDIYLERSRSNHVATSPHSLEALPVGHHQGPVLWRRPSE